MNITGINVSEYLPYGQAKEYVLIEECRTFLTRMELIDMIDPIIVLVILLIGFLSYKYLEKEDIKYKGFKNQEMSLKKTVGSIYIFLMILGIIYFLIKWLS